MTVIQKIIYNHVPQQKPPVFKLIQTKKSIRQFKNVIQCDSHIRDELTVGREWVFIQMDTMEWININNKTVGGVTAFIKKAFSLKAMENK